MKKTIGNNYFEIGRLMKQRIPFQKLYTKRKGYYYVKAIKADWSKHLLN